MGCCQTQQLKIDENEEEMQEKEFTIHKEIDGPLGLRVNDSDMIIESVAGASAEHSEYIGWKITGVNGNDILKRDQLATEEIRQSETVLIRVERIYTIEQSPVNQSTISPTGTSSPQAATDALEPEEHNNVNVSNQTVITINKSCSDPVGLKLENGMIKAVSGIAFQQGLSKYINWKVISVNGIPGTDFQEASKGETISVTLEYTQSFKKVNALRKLCKKIIQRRKVDDMMFMLIHRDLEIQEEREMNMIDDSETDDEGSISSQDESESDFSEEPEIETDRLETIYSSLLGPNTILPSENDAISILTNSLQKMKAFDNIRKITVPQRGRLIVVGDLHGQLADLHYIIKSFGPPSKRNLFLFNGDFVDRGEQSVEVVLTVLLLFLRNPQHIFLNRGNHEDYRINAKYGFDKECSELKYTSRTFDVFQKLFRRLPLVHTCNKFAVVMHGGLPHVDPSSLSFSKINSIERNRKVPRTSKHMSTEDTIFQGLLWSDPHDQLGTQQFRESKRGAGTYFSESATQQFLDKNNMSNGVIIRSHQTTDEGYKSHHNSKVHTVFSASQYRGKENNKGAVVILSNPSDGMMNLTYAQWTSEDKKKINSGLTRYVESAVASKDDVLRRVKELIFRNQTVLLSEFQSLDTSEEGKVTRLQWTTVMNRVCPGLPWCFLSRHVPTCELDGYIAYVPFIEEAQSLLSQKWITSWCDEVLPYIILRIGECIKDIEGVFTSIDSNMTSKLSYHELSLFLTHRQHLHFLDNRAVYYILRSIDTNRDGFISLSEFKNTFEKRYNLIKGTDQDNMLGRIWESRFNVDTKRVFEKFLEQFRRLEAKGVSNDDENIKKSKKKKKQKESKGITVEQFTTLGKNSFNGTEERWKTTANQLLSGSRVRVKHLLRRLRAMDQLEAQAVIVSDICTRLCRSKISLRCFFNRINYGSDVTATELRTAVQSLGITIDSNTWKVLWSLIDVNNDGKVSLQEFINSLEVSDNWNSNSTLGSSKRNEGTVKKPKKQLKTKKTEKKKKKTRKKVIHGEE